MFSKNPFILPAFAAVFIVILYLFQQQQKKKAEMLRAAEVKDTVAVALTLKDPVFGSSQGVPGKCTDGKAYGLEYPVPGKLERGRVEFDLFNFSQSEVENIPLFALHPASAPPCPQSLPDHSLLGLFLNIKTDSLKLIMRTAAGVFTGAARLSDKESPPFRLAVEWLADTATIFVNGKRNTDIIYKGALAQGDNRLFLGESQGKKCAELRSLKLYLVP
jgi:hypothetical protein